MEAQPAGVRLAVVYYSATGSVHALANAVADGARSAGAEVRLRRVPELAGEDAIDADPTWRSHVDATKYTVAEATLNDLEWANAYAFGTPTRYGLPAAQLLAAARYQGQLITRIADRLANCSRRRDVPAAAI